MRVPATITALLLLTGGAALADIAPAASVVAPVPLSQVSDPPDRVATAKVTDADGTVIGTVQKVDLRNGKPVRIDVTLLGSENTVTLDASTVRYDAATNVVASNGPLRARPQA